MKFFLAVSFLLLSFSCSKKMVPSSGFSENIIIKLQNDESGGLQLICYTEKIFPCVNFTIDHHLQRKSNRIEIAFTGISKPPICLTALGAATTIIRLNDLKETTYSLEIHNGAPTSTGVLKVTPDNFSIDLESSPGLNIENSPLHR